MWLRSILFTLLVIATTGEVQQKDIVTVEDPYIQVYDKPVDGSSVVMDTKRKTKFTCIADHGDPPPQLGWRLNGEELKSDRNYVKRDRYPSTLSFVVSEVNLMQNLTFHNMKLECIVYSENYEHNKTTSLILNVIHNATEVHIGPPLSLTLDKGEEKELSCLSNGYPLPRYTWVKELKSVDESVPDMWVTVSRGQKLTLGKSGKDSGTYVCRAHNSEPHKTVIQSPEQAEVQINGADTTSKYSAFWILFAVSIQFLLNKV